MLNTLNKLPAERLASSSRRRFGRLMTGMLAGLAASVAIFPGVAFAQESSVTLSYGLWDISQTPAMQQIIDEFHEANPNINVKIQLTPWKDYWTKLQTSASGGTAPDVFWMNLDNLMLYAEGNQLLRLDDMIERDGVDMSNYVSAIAEGYQYKGATYGMPKDVNAFGIFYNKNLYTAAGVEFPNASWTWDDLADAAKKLTDPSKGVYGIVAPLNEEMTWYLSIPSFGGYIISEDGKKSGYDTPESIKGIQFWVDLINKYHVSPTLQQTTDTDYRTLFTSGKVATFIGGSWEPAAFAEIPEALAFTDVSPLPKGDSPHYYSNGLGNVVYAKTPHPAEAWKFVKFLGSKRAAEIQASTGTVIPAYLGQADSFAQAYPWMNAQELINQLPNALPYPVSLKTEAWYNMQLQEFAKAWTGEVPVTDVAKIVTEKMNALLASEQ
jgi:multiple sugar transport system substrate-binding protein